MRRIGSSPFAFPDFSGATRQLILINLCTYFALVIAGLASAETASFLAGRMAFDPFSFLHGALWQPLTYSFIHLGIVATLFELLSLWFLAGFLESLHNANWILWLYAVSVLGTAAAALAIYAVSHTWLGPSLHLAIRLLWRHLRPAGGHRHPLWRRTVHALSAAHRHQGSLPGGYLRADRRSPCSSASSGMYAFAAVGRRAGRPALCAHGAAQRHLVRPSARAGTACATAITAGSAAAPPASSRSTCARRAAPSASTARAAIIDEDPDDKKRWN